MSQRQYFWPQEHKNGIASTAVIESKYIGKNVSIGHHCYIGPGVRIGEGVVIENNVSIKNNVAIGGNCLIHLSVCIGTDGFGFYMDEKWQPHKVDHYGGVTIGCDVEIGANTCIDRGTLDNTIIGNRVKIDNLCHISHNV